MPVTNFALYDLFVAPVLAAALHSCPMLDTDSALYNFIAAPDLAAALHSCPMLDTDSALYDFIAAPVLAAAMLDTDSALLVMPHTYDPPCMMTQG